MMQSLLPGELSLFNGKETFCLWVKLSTQVQVDSVEG